MVRLLTFLRTLTSPLPLPLMTFGIYCQDVLDKLTHREMQCDVSTQSRPNNRSNGRNVNKIPEFESAIRSLHREAWPNATHAQRDSDLKRKFEYGVSHPDLLSHLQIHAHYDNFENIVLKARHFIDAHEIARAPKKSVRIITPPPIDHDDVNTPSTSNPFVTDTVPPLVAPMAQKNNPWVQRSGDPGPIAPSPNAYSPNPNPAFH